MVRGISLDHIFFGNWYVTAQKDIACKQKQTNKQKTTTMRRMFFLQNQYAVKFSHAFAYVRFVFLFQIMDQNAVILALLRKNDTLVILVVPALCQ